MGSPNRDEIESKAKQAAGEAKRKDSRMSATKRRRESEDVLEEAEGEVQQKDGGQDRQSGEAVEDQRERIRRNARRF